MACRHSWSSYVIGSLFVMCILLPATFSMPKHRSDYNEEPEPIPVHLLRIPMQVDVPDRKIDDFPEIGRRSQVKRSHHNNHLSEVPTTSCCPTNREITQPILGKNRAGDLVELYQTESVRQRFYEISCAPEIAEKPCQFLTKEYEPFSRCEQDYSYTYALVRDKPRRDEYIRSDHGWRLDYILVRSGCSCQIATDTENTD